MESSQPTAHTFLRMWLLDAVFDVTGNEMCPAVLFAFFLRCQSQQTGSSSLQVAPASLALLPPPPCAPRTPHACALRTAHACVLHPAAICFERHAGRANPHLSNSSDTRGRL